MLILQVEGGEMMPRVRPSFTFVIQGLCINGLNALMPWLGWGTLSQKPDHLRDDHNYTSKNRNSTSSDCTDSTENIQVGRILVIVIIVMIMTITMVL